MGYPYQTSVQNIDGVRFGGAKLEVTATIGTTAGTTYTNLGVVKGLTIKEDVTRAWVGSDNAIPRPLVAKQRVVISGTFVEYDPTAWDIIRGGIDIFTTGGVTPSTKKVQSGGYHAQLPFQVQATNYTVTTSAVGDSTYDLRLNVWKCFDNGGLEFAFQPDEDENPMEMPFEFLGVPASSRTLASGKLFQICDEQSTS